jgi:hypothetical protein
MLTTWSAGSVEGPWNHTKRLEQKLGSRLRIVGLVDLDQTKARAVIDEKRALIKDSYDYTEVFGSIASAAEGLKDARLPQ